MSRSGIDSFIKCQRCFYLNKVGNIKDIGMPGFSLNSAHDELMKKELDIYREKGEAHPYMESLERNLIPFQHENMEDWRNNFKGVTYHHEKTDLIITGAIDDVWIDTDTNELVIVEYKSTSTQSVIDLNDGTPWKEQYKRQIDIYQWLFKMNGFPVADDSVFLYSNGIKTSKKFNDVMKFKTYILEYKGSTEWVEPKILEIKKVLDQMSLPNLNENCDTCSYVESVQTYNT
ncbi:MAG: hypothetical protein CL493_02945 [Actinobacteria bacterium]|nr:hypothetical protein [Actinomycetota bacterium]